MNTMTMASQTIPEVSEVSTQNACTSAVTDFDSNAAFAGDDTPRLSQDSDLKIEEKVSAAQGTLQGVKKVQEEMMKSILQQMEALENQHICLQLGQVRFVQHLYNQPHTVLHRDNTRAYHVRIARAVITTFGGWDKFNINPERQSSYLPVKDACDSTILLVKPSGGLGIIATRLCVTAGATRG